MILLTSVDKDFINNSFWWFLLTSVYDFINLCLFYDFINRSL